MRWAACCPPSTIPACQAMHRIPRGIHLQALLHSPLHQLQPLLANLLPLLIHKHHRPAPGEDKAGAVARYSPPPQATKANIAADNLVSALAKQHSLKQHSLNPSPSRSAAHSFEAFWLASCAAVRSAVRLAVLSTGLESMIASRMWSYLSRSACREGPQP